MENSDKFIQSFKSIEQLLKKILNIEEYISFNKMVEDASRKNSTIQNYKIDLKEFAELRNAIVHQRTDDNRAIAEPHPQTVSQIIAIVEKIENPLKVIPEFHSKIETVEAGAKISDALDRFYKGDYSQLPVIENGKFIDLLTTDTVTRWIAASKDGEGYLLLNVAVREVLPYKEFEENYRFISRNTTLVEALKIIEEVEYKDRPLDALLITDGGKKEQKLLGVITHYDISRMVSLL